MTDAVYQKCLSPSCGATAEVSDLRTDCPRCRGLMDVAYDWDRLSPPRSLREIEAKWSNRLNPLDFSGVWRFRNLLPFAPEHKIITIGEGQTLLSRADGVADYTGMNPGSLFLQYEGLNPSGSFKDNGMTAAITHANMVGAQAAACASTGNTSASLAIYASATQQFQVFVFVGSGKIAYGKLSQALDYGAKTLQLLGDFDDAMAQVLQVCGNGKIYLCNSVNPFRLEGQKTIIFRILEALGWEVPDWIVVPGGNLGNSSAFGKALIELKQLGLIDRLPRLAIINAAGANTLRQLTDAGLSWNNGNPDMELIEKFYARMDAEKRKADTLATAIQINRPVNLLKALRALDATNGIVREVTDQQILDAKAKIGAGGFGCEPASAASVAGTKLLRAEGVIAPSDRVVCILTGHQLKDPNLTVAYHTPGKQESRDLLAVNHVTQTPYANQPVVVENNLDAILQAIQNLRTV